MAFITAPYITLSPVVVGNIRLGCISLNATDRLRLIALPPEMTPVIRDAIRRSWGIIQFEQPYFGAHEFILWGNPWWGLYEESVRSRRLIAAVLQAMAINGWNLVQSVDCSRKDKDKDSLFFELANPDPEAHIFAVSFNSSDRIRVIDAPAFFPMVIDAVVRQWHRGVQFQRDFFGALEVKLFGYPWYPDGSEAVFGRLILCQIIANMKAQGYKLYGSIDLNAEERDLESWFFRKVTPQWT